MHICRILQQKVVLSLDEGRGLGQVLEEEREVEELGRLHVLLCLLQGLLYLRGSDGRWHFGIFLDELCDESMNVVVDGSIVVIVVGSMVVVVIVIGGGKSSGQKSINFFQSSVLFPVLDGRFVGQGWQEGIESLGRGLDATELSVIGQVVVVVVVIVGLFSRHGGRSRGWSRSRRSSSSSSRSLTKAPCGCHHHRVGFPVLVGCWWLLRLLRQWFILLLLGLSLFGILVGGRRFRLLLLLWDYDERVVDKGRVVKVKGIVVLHQEHVQVQTVQRVSLAGADHVVVSSSCCC